ncbi:hypothetical protein N7492_006906 [Penicillium capsulatum]|uniref:Transcription factor domain-containing protein n=1 Tax=Penicillium capsulatum TaxID=69766 RepID=A0A9W9I096_9EURO|nr:hypothetical protein N7492_006906 [Penicillium capsulatum]
MAFDTGDAFSTVRSELASIEKQLSASGPSHCPLHEMSTGSLNDVVTPEMYRLVCLMYTRQVLNPALRIEHAAIQDLVDEFMKQLGHLPPNSPSDSILCWPLVVAGLCVTLNVYQRLIIAKLNQIYELWQSDVFSERTISSRKMAQGSYGATWLSSVFIHLATADDPPSNGGDEYKDLDTNVCNIGLAHWGPIKMDLNGVNLCV